MRYEIVIAGIGGQGIVLSGTIVGTAAAVFGGLNATQIASYGPEAMGGRVYTEVVISDEEIDYPRVSSPDILVVMSQRGYNEFSRKVKPGGLIIYDPDLVEISRLEEVEQIAIPATKEAERLGLRISANMVMIGALTAFCDLLEPEMVEEAIRSRVRRSLETNLKAFRRGYELALSLRGASGR